ncbi:mannose-1-phosphate guanylyltransferase [Candidatus Pacearchaeota archaeon]|nr:mannose-1-phosphate guanylyltransferase [Candidatus Pacearchaeota archaeon]|tara:strand:+ start:25557 stop:26537 length:981 start_codon:yes stop_codon:yes gene_type:complete
MIKGIILAGGTGTRFWPLSRPDKPKQLLPLISDKTLLEQTITRLQPAVDNMYISTNPNLAQIMKNIVNTEFILEPEKRDTAAAIGLCAINFEADDILVFIPSDAHVYPDEEFQKTIKQAINLADSDIVVIGIPPANPATAYGYLEVGQENKVISFKEKPDKETAVEYVKKDYLWNAGIFVVKVSTLLSLFKEHAQNIYDDLLKIKQGQPIEKIYPLIEKISFDYAIMEKAKNVKYVKATFSWSDLGSFDTLEEFIQGENKIINGELLHINSKGNIVHSNKKIALIDCQDLAIIDTDDVLLVCPKKSSQKIKDLVKEYCKEGTSPSS